MDTLGLLLSIYTTPASTGDRWGAKACLGGKKYFLPRLKKIWADANYTGDDLAQTCARDGWKLEIVERTLAWFLKYRRLQVDHERKPQTGESFIKIAMIRLMTREVSSQVGGVLIISKQSLTHMTRQLDTSRLK